MSVGELSLEIGIKMGDFKSVELHGSTDRRLLIVDDTPGIHEDFRKILCEGEPSEYDRLQDEIFGSQTGLPRRKRFLIHSEQTFASRSKIFDEGKNSHLNS
jgi:hypothetical protein